MKKALFVLGFTLAFSNFSYSQCSNFDINIGFPYFTDSDCSDNIMTVCSDITVTFSNGNASWQYGYYVNGVLDFMSSISNTNNLGSVTVCSTTSCSDAVQFFVNSWSAPNGGGNMCAQVMSLPAMLPVDFGKFQGVERNGSVHLTWETLTEVNNERFEIQRSTELSNFKTIGEVSGNGFSESLQSYTYIDNSALNLKSYYYRIKQYDYDGNYGFSEVIRVTLEGETHGAYLFPNPADSYVLIPSNITGLEVMNNRGQILNVFNNPTERLDVSSLPSGTYYLRLRFQDGTVNTQEIVKL